MNDEQVYVMAQVRKAIFPNLMTHTELGLLVQTVLEAIADYTEQTEPYALETIRRLRETASTVGMSLGGT